MWSAEYWAEKGPVRLYVYRKRSEAPAAGGPKPVLFCVHGSTVSGRTTYDLQVPGRADYSVMDWFAARGFDVWTMDHEGYGRSKGPGNSGVIDGAEDLRHAVAIVERETGARRIAFFGSSSGALRAARFTAENPDRVERLSLSALVYTGRDSPTLAQRRKNVEEYRRSNRRKVDLAFYQGMFNRDRPGSSEAIVPEAIAAAELPLVTEVPTGTYLEMCESLPIVDPARIPCPVQIIRGEFDGIAADPDLLDFYTRLPTRDKHFVMLSGIAHNPMMGVARHKFHHILHSFLTMRFEA